MRDGSERSLPFLRFCRNFNEYGLRPVHEFLRGIGGSPLLHCIFHYKNNESAYFLQIYRFYIDYFIIYW